MLTILTKDLEAKEGEEDTSRSDSDDSEVEGDEIHEPENWDGEEEGDGKMTPGRSRCYRL